MSDLSHVPMAYRTGTHVASPALHTLVAAIRDSGADFVLVTGDLTDRGTVAELKAGSRLMSRIGVPFRLVPGNHDHYGHQDEPRQGDVPVSDGELGTGTFTRWQEVVGPRWWSLNHAGLHLVALDWFSARAGTDGAIQMRWLLSDLGRLRDGTPVILLVHDQPDGRFLQQLTSAAPHIRLMAVLSGHWHAPRSVKANGTWHMSGGPALVPGRNLAPPQLRLLTWDGGSLDSRTILYARPNVPRQQSRPPRWGFQTRLPAVHDLHLAPHPGGAVATTADHDRARGEVRFLDGRTGRTRWSWSCPQPITAAAAVDADGAAYVQCAGGLVLRIDAGRPSWMAEAPDPVATHVSNPPILTGDGGVLTEGPESIRCLRCSDGRVRWSRYIGLSGVHRVQPAGALCDGRAVLSLARYTYGLTAIDVNDGSILWQDEQPKAPPVGSPRMLDTSTAVIVREGGLVERFELATGRAHWTTALSAQPSLAPPLVVDDLVLVVSENAEIHVIDGKTGWLLRVHRLARDSRFVPMPVNHPLVGEAVVGIGRQVHVITVTGQWWALNAYGSEAALVAQLPFSVTAAPVRSGDHLLVPGREGIVVACRWFEEARRWPQLQDAVGQGSNL